MGAINVKHTGSGADVNISSDGTDLLLNGTAIGGGGAALELYAENPSSPTAPSATGTNAVAIGESAVAAGTKALSGPVSYANGFNSFAAANADNSGSYGAKGDYSVALGFRANATLAYSIAVGPQSSALGNYSTALGRQAVSVADSVAMAKSYASGTDSFAAAIANSSSSYGATGANSVAIGQQNKATSTGGLALGRNAISTVQDAVSIGLQCTADATNSIALGAYSSTKGIKGRIAFSGVSSNYQQGTFVLAKQTSDATPNVLTYNTAAASTDNQVILPNNSAYSFSGTIIARQQASAGSEYASWEIKGALLRDGTAASTVLGNGIKNKLFASAGASAWDIALTADTINGGLAITVTGAAATNIRWVATVNTSEVTY